MPRNDGDRHTDETRNERVPVQRETAFGTAKLLPDLDDEGGWLLTLDGTPQSYVDLADPGHLEFEYVQRLGHLTEALAPEGHALTVLHLGGGALTLPRYLAATRPARASRWPRRTGRWSSWSARYCRGRSRRSR